MASLVYARDSVWVAHGGHRILLNAGEAWDAADPLVRARPELFANQPVTVRRTDDRSGVASHPLEVIESATAGPGERRSTRRAG